jgi:hypothetical protein
LSAVGSPMFRHCAALRAVPRTSLLRRWVVVLPPVVLYACGRLCLTRPRLLAVVCGAGDQSQLRLRRASGGPGSGKRGVCRPAACLLGGGGPVGCPPRLAPEATRLLPGAQPAGALSGFAGIWSSPVALPAEARSGFACQARGTTNLGRDACAALRPKPRPCRPMQNLASGDDLRPRADPITPLRGNIPAGEPRRLSLAGIFHIEPRSDPRSTVSSRASGSTLTAKFHLTRPARTSR